MHTYIYSRIMLLCAAGENKNSSKKNLKCLDKNLLQAGSKYLLQVMLQGLRQGQQKFYSLSTKMPMQKT